jgi:CMP/dCMP kinase
MIIAIDGPTASGKGTVARALAAHFGLPHLDTGLLYRAVGVQTARMGGDPDREGDALAACDFPDALLHDPELRLEASGALASRASVHPAVGATFFQRAFAAQPGGGVLDGRDIGTVIAPHADAKLFIVASTGARARRRLAELAARGVGADLAVLTADIAARDARDAGRATAPLVRADDADLLDTSNLTIGDAVQRAIALVEARLSRRSS